MAPFYEKVERTLEIAPSTKEARGPVSDMIARGADALGYEHLPVRRNARDCDGQGVCHWGCPTDAKQSDERHLRPVGALEGGAQLFTGLARHRGAWSRANARWACAGGAAPRRPAGQVRARAVILACGALQTPVLLLKNGIANTTGGQVGRNLSVHPAHRLVSALMDERVDPFAHVPQGYAVTQFVREGILILGAIAPIDAAAAYFLSQGRSYTELMDAYANVASLGVMVEDHARGRVTPGANGFPRVIRYMVSNKDTARQLQRGLVTLGRRCISRRVRAG